MVQDTKISETLAIIISNAEEQQAAAVELASHVKTTGASSLLQNGVLDALKAATLDKKSDIARLGAMYAYKELATQLGHPSEPYLIPELTAILAGYGDKSAAVRDAAALAGDALFSLAGRFSVKLLVPVLLENLSNEKKWQTKMAALSFIKNLTKTSASQVQLCLPMIIPIVSDCMWATKPEVS